MIISESGDDAAEEGDEDLQRSAPDGLSGGPGNAGECRGDGGSQSTVEDADAKGEAEIRARRPQSDDDKLDFLQSSLIIPVRGRNRKVW